mmetsp:Transcript_7469/g.20805  ORF Transcript_7469/g.20805 Transcript_7469/m.20805 type:complete len:200 (+) Transcript_7469:564-1163(+)
MKLILTPNKLLRRPPPRPLRDGGRRLSSSTTRRPFPLLLLRRHGGLASRYSFRRRVVRGKSAMRSKFLGIARQFIHFIELLVPAHEVQADLHGFPLIITLDANDARVEPAARLPTARVDLGPFDDRRIGQRRAVEDDVVLAEGRFRDVAGRFVRYHSPLDLVRALEGRVLVDLDRRVPGHAPPLLAEVAGHPPAGRLVR